MEITQNRTTSHRKVGNNENAKGKTTFFSLYFTDVTKVCTNVKCVINKRLKKKTVSKVTNTIDLGLPRP